LKPIDAIQPLGDEGTSLLEEAIRRYEAEGAEESAHVASCLRAMPPRWAMSMLVIREYAKKTYKWQNDDSAPVRFSHAAGIHEEKLERCAPDVHDPKNAATPRTCHQCGGVRWMRMVNHHPIPVDIATENARVTRQYGPDESYLVPCNKCSPRRCLEYRTRKPLGEKEPRDPRKPKGYNRDEED
jgi:hypothetical protein